MPASPPRVTLSDVAAVAGVSLSTASKALNGTERVSEETRGRVREVAERLGFRPDALARSFASGRSRTIGVLAHRAASTFAQPVLIGAFRELGHRDLAGVLYDTDDGRWTGEHIDSLRARRVDGVLVVGVGHEALAASVTRRFDQPVAYAFCQSTEVEDSSFLPDNTATGRMATEHLIALGRRRIAHITGPRSSLAARERAEGMISTLREAGLDPVAPVIHSTWHQDSGVAAMTRLLQRDVHVDAVFCGNDHLALGALEVLERHGRRVPDDVAVIGVDNWEGIVIDQGTRRLTTIDQRLGEVGALAAAHLAGVPSHSMAGADGMPVTDAVAGSGVRLVRPRLIVGPSTVA